MSTTDDNTTHRRAPRPRAPGRGRHGRWEDAVRLQRWATPDHADFYALAGEMVATLHALDDLAQVLRRQVAGYADPAGRAARSTTTPAQVDPPSPAGRGGRRARSRRSSTSEAARHRPPARSAVGRHAVSRSTRSAHIGVRRHAGAADRRASTAWRPRVRRRRWLVTGRGTLYVLLTVVAGAAAMLSFAALRDLALLCGFAPGAGVAAAGGRRRRGRRRVAGLARRAHRRARRGGSPAGSRSGCSACRSRPTRSGTAWPRSCCCPPWWVVVVLSGIAPAVLGAMVHLAVLVGRTGRPPTIDRRPTSTTSRSRTSWPTTRPTRSTSARPVPPLGRRAGRRRRSRRPDRAAVLIAAGRRSPPAVPRAGRHRVRGPPAARSTPGPPTTDAARHARPTAPRAATERRRDIRPPLWSCHGRLHSRRPPGLAPRRPAHRASAASPSAAPVRASRSWRVERIPLCCSPSSVAGRRSAGRGTGSPRTSATVTRWGARTRRKSGVASGARHRPRRGRGRRCAARPPPSAPPSRPTGGGRGGGSCSRLPVAEVAVRLCRVGLLRVWVSVEDVVLVFGGPRTGKTQYLAGRIIDAPGAVLVTSTRTDLSTRPRPLRGAAGAGVRVQPGRARRAPVDDHVRPADRLRRPGDRGGAGRGHARRHRARLPRRGSGEREFWDAQGRRDLAALLHAAALAGDCRWPTSSPGCPTSPRHQAQITGAAAHASPEPKTFEIGRPVHRDQLAHPHLDHLDDLPRAGVAGPQARRRPPRCPSATAAGRSTSPSCSPPRGTVYMLGGEEPRSPRWCAR